VVPGIRGRLTYCTNLLLTARWFGWRASADRRFGAFPHHVTSAATAASRFFDPSDCQLYPTS